MEELIKITKALSDINRVRIVMGLIKGELCVCQITELLKLAPSTVSKHMLILRNASLVKSRKDGRWIYYSLSAKSSSNMVKKSIELLKSAIGQDERVLNDRELIKRIICIDQEELCRRRLKGKK